MRCGATGRRPGNEAMCVGCGVMWCVCAVCACRPHYSHVHFDDNFPKFKVFLNVSRPPVQRLNIVLW